MNNGAAAARPGNKVIQLAPDGRPSIVGFRCGDCGAVMPERTMACRACASRRAPEAFRAAETGRLYSWTLVHRSYPGVEVPFVSAIVDLDDGLTLKGTLRGADAAGLRQGLALRLVFDDAGGAKDEDGASYVGFHFLLCGDA